MNKKSQITIFIIIGIILLFSTLLIVYVTKKAGGPTEPEELEKHYDSPLSMYIEGCVENLGENALYMIGQRGGYLSLDDFDTKAASFDQFNSDVLSLDGGKLNIPYWYYQKNGIDRYKVPKLNKEYEGDKSIQTQIESHIIENFKKSCDLSTFTEKGIEIIETGNITTEVMFNAEDVMIKLTYPIMVVEEGRDTAMDVFYVRVPVRMARIYKLAKEIAEMERNFVFLEQATMDLVSLFSKVDSSYLPPPYGSLEFSSCTDIEYWFYNDVQENLKNMLAFNIPYFKIGNSKYDRIMISGEEEPDENNRKIRQGIFDHLRFRVSRDVYPYIEVGFLFDQGYPLKLDFGTYGLLEPNKIEMNILIAQLCMFDYKFAYDIAYPVLFTLRDEKSYLNNQPFVFTFPIQVVIKDNFPRIRTSTLNPIPEFEPPTYFCDLENRVAEDITVRVVDDDEQPIKDAVVYFQCGPQYVYEYDEEGNVTGVEHFSDRCFIGKTDENGEVKEPFPECIGAGLAIAVADGFLEQTFLVGDVEKDKSAIHKITLQRTKRINVELLKYFVSGPAKDDDTTDIIVNEDNEVVKCRITSTPMKLRQFESALIRMEKLDNLNGQLNIPPIIIYKEDNETDNSLVLAPGEYVVDIMLLRNERHPGEMTIKAKSECETVEKGLETEEVCYPDEDVLIPQAIVGGAVFTMEITKEDLEKSILTVYVTDEGLPEIATQIGQPYNHAGACVSLNKELFKPRFS